MTPLDEAPEHRWRRTVDRRNRPAKLKVDRLLRDFGYEELDPAVGDAIEARLAGVALAVAPSLRDAAAGEVVTIYANDSAAPEAEPAASDAGAAAPPPAEEPAVASDVAQMVTYLKQQVLDARGEAERLRTELDRRIAARMDSERESEQIIAEQAAALERQSGQLAELGAALNSTRQALAETRDEIRRAVGELQALPQPAISDDPPPPAGVGLVPVEPEAADEDSGDEASLSGEEWADGREEAEATGPAPAEPAADEPAPEVWYPPDSAAPAAGHAGSDLDEPALAGGEPAAERGDPVVAAEDLALDVGDAAPAPPDPVFELDEPGLEVEGASPRAAQEPDFDLEAPASPREREPVPALEDPAFDLGEPPPAPGKEASREEPELELDLDEPAHDAVPAAAGDEPEFDLGERAARAANDPADDLDAPLPPSDEWLPVDLRPQAEEGGEGLAAAGEAESVEALTDFDDFLYGTDELYDPAAPDPAAFDTPLESEIEARWPDEPETALPPPPPAPPSPWADEPDPQQPPAIAERATLGKVLRGRGGRGRGRWEGSCSICGRQPQENRRKDLQAAGWDLDDDAPVCPQCRGVG